MCFEPAFWFNSTAFAGLTAQKILLVKPLFLRVLIIAFISTLLSAVVNEIPSFINESANLETKFGLDALFWLRGVRQPPKEIVIVTIDEDSDKEYQIGHEPIKWRDKHAGLIQELKRQEVALIVFDLYFSAPQSHDSILANAMLEAGNVLAGECLQTNESGWGECGEPPGQTLPKHSPIQIINYPTPKLAKSMLDHGLFYLAYGGGDNVIKQSWTFLDSPIDRPTLPVLSWFHYLYQKGSLQKIIQPTHPLSDWLSEQRKKCYSTINGTVKSLPKSNIEIRANDLICHGNSRYLDFYGPPKTFRMESYSAVREGRVSDLKDKIVFIGKVPVNNPSQNDSFNTPTTKKNGELMVGVEVMATFFANLLEDREIKHPLPIVLVMVIFGVIVSFLLTKFVGRNGIVASLLFSACYAELAVMGFNNYAMWLPLFVPLLLQLPIASFISLYWWHIDHVKEEKRLKAIIDQLEKENKEEVNRFIDEFKKTYNPNLEIKKIRSKGEVSGVCLVSDVEGSVELCQKHTSSESSAIFSEYFKVLEPIVSSLGGEIVQIAGDGMIAIWVDPMLANKKLAACEAAIKMKQAVDEYYSSGRTVLSTRFGLHEGTFTLEQIWPEKPDKPGNVVGDVVNTASRIEQVNKILGTKILASSLVAIDLKNIITRPVGAFPLKGKTYPLSLVEIVSIKSETNLRKYFLIRRYFYHFKHGLKAFQSGDWVAAQKVFCTLNEKNINDGPTKYYLKMSQIYLDNPPSK